jgi:mRNA interferase RelE/StbE
MYDLRILDAAEVDLTRLDRSVARRIVNRIQWLAEHFDDLKPELLAGMLSGFYKFRVGDYRIIYKVYKNENLMVIHRIGHRREVYKL